MTDLRERFQVSPRRYQLFTSLALFALSLIVSTGAAVRLTGSGLGCPDWPQCHGGLVAPLELHSVIEYGNRLVALPVGVAALLAFVGAFFRRPYRRDLVVLSACLPLGVVAQAVLGGFTVRHHLAPGFVMGHFGLSMIILIAAFALFWRARYEAGVRPRQDTLLLVWLTRAVFLIGAVVVFAGMVATAAGPHAGSSGTGEIVHRLDFLGSDTLEWAIHQHGRLGTFLVMCTVLLLLYRRRGGQHEQQRRRSLTTLTVLLCLQGAVGLTQYKLKLPTELVWIHVTLATAVWVALLWVVAAAGRPAKSSAGL